MWHNLDILSCLGTPLGRPFSIWSWWDDTLSCPIATLDAFGKNVSRYFGCIKKPNLKKHNQVFLIVQHFSGKVLLLHGLSGIPQQKEGWF